MDTLTLKIDGMHCGACVKRVNKALSDVPGVEIEQVGIGVAEVRYDETATSPESIAAAVAKAGYPAEKAS